MEPIVTMIQETGQHVSKQSTAIVLRTRDAGAAFVEETREAGRELVHFVQSEAKRWKRYVRLRVGTLEKGARAALTPVGLEKRVLVTVDDTLRALDARVRGRLSALEKRSRKPARRTARPTATRKKAAAGKANGVSAHAAH